MLHCACILQAVAGVVGCAELISTLWSLPALLLYSMAVDGRYPAAQEIEQHDSSSQKASSSRTAAGGNTPSNRMKQPRQAQQAVGRLRGSNTEQQLQGQLPTADVLQHWGLVVSSAALAFIAALSKEIGITIIGTMMVYDLLYAPHVIEQQHSAQSSLVLVNDVRKQQHIQVCRRQMLRLLFLLITAVGYVKLRSWVAVEQLVAIYRKVSCVLNFEKAAYHQLLNLLLSNLVQRLDDSYRLQTSCVV